MYIPVTTSETSFFLKRFNFDKCFSKLMSFTEKELFHL